MHKTLRGQARAVGCLALAFLALGFAGSASAEYGFCTISKDRGYDEYLSGVIDIGNDPDAYRVVLVGQFGEQFRSYIGQFEEYARPPDCHSSKRLSDAEYMVRNLSISGDIGKVIRTGWIGNWPAPGKDAPKPEPSGAHLTVEPVKPVESAAAVAARKLEQEAAARANAQAAAAQRAKELAQASGKDAALQALIEADRAARLKCRSCQ